MKRITTIGLLAAMGLAPVLLAMGVDPAAAREDPAERAVRRAKRRTAVVDAVEKAAPSVVSIGTTQLVRVRRFWTWDFLVREQPGALGSGVIVHPDGYVITNAHVINQAATITVTRTGDGSGKEHAAELVAVDLENDLALVKIEGAGPHPAARFGRTDDLMLGETTIAMGSPFGLKNTVTVGIVSSIGRDIRVRDQSFTGLIQTDAAVNSGNSGGALLNILGEWIGVNSAIYSLSGGSDGIGFAIPVETVRTFIVEALRPRRIAGRWLGVEFERREDGVVVVGTVYPVGPAADAGLRRGQVLLDPQGRQQVDLVQTTYSVLNALPQGSFRVRIGEGEGAREVVLPFAPLPTQKIAWDRIGIRAAKVTPEVTERIGYREGAGVLVSEVRPGSAAERVGLKPNDLLVGLGKHRIRTLEHVLVSLQFTKQGDAFDVHLVRPRRHEFGIDYENWKARVTAD